MKFVLKNRLICRIWFAFLCLAASGALAQAQSIEYIGGIETTGSDAKWLAVKDNIAYVVDREYGISMVDISEPASPAAIGLFQVQFFVYPGYQDFVISGDRGYLVVNDHQGKSAILGLDLSSPTSPTVTHHFLFPYGTDSKLAVDASEVCIYGYAEAVGNSGILRIDFSNPNTTPTLTSMWMTSMPSNVSVDISGEISVVTGSDSVASPGFMVYETPQFNSTRLRGHSGLHLGKPIDIKLRGNRVYLALTHTYSWENAIEVYDISNPSVPKLQGSYYYPERTAAITEQGGIVYVATLNGIVKVFDARDASDLKLVTQTNTPGFAGAEDIVVNGELVYVAMGAGGFGIFKTTGIESNRAVDWKTYP